MAPETELALIAIQDMVCEVHNRKITNGEIIDGINLKYEVCCAEFGEKISNKIFDTVNEYFGYVPRSEK